MEKAFEIAAAGNLRLRAYRETDLADFLAAARESAESVGLWLDWCHEDIGQAEVLEWFGLCDANRAAGTAWELGIFENAGGQAAAGEPCAGDLLGGIGINRINLRDKSGNIGYWVRQSRQGRGIATAAVRAIARFGFEQLGLVRLEIVVAEGNAASMRVAEKAGAQFECMARNRLIIHGLPRMGAVYSLIPE